MILGGDVMNGTKKWMYRGQIISGMYDYMFNMNNMTLCLFFV
jgi:hypothetical protein